MYNKAETYNEYKVFKTTAINSFWNNVEDSLQAYKEKISQSRQEIGNLNNRIDSLGQRINELEQALDESRAEADSISFIGIPFSESVYHIFVWSMIGGLAILAFLGYGSHTRSKRLYNKIHHEHNKLLEEIEAVRKKYLDYKVKMGRELQTERNKIMDLESRLSTSANRSSR